MSKNHTKAASPKQVEDALAQENTAGEDFPVTTAAKSTTPLSVSGVAGFKLKKLITVPSLVLKNLDQEVVVRIDSQIEVSKIVDTKSKREPANVCDVVDMVTGQQFKFLVPAVVKKNLEDGYPDGGYVGKVFLIKNMGKRSDTQRYVDYGVAELEAA